jgi:hypothetical protein
MERDVVMNKNILHKLLEEKKLAETLMQDEDFKNKAKKILKEENVDITDKDVMNILKATEKALSGDVKIENEADLDEVSGGSCTDFCKSVARVTIETCCTAAGVGGALVIGGNVMDYIDKKTSTESESSEKSGEYFEKLAADNLITFAGAGAGGVMGYKFGKFLCSTLGLK